MVVVVVVVVVVVIVVVVAAFPLQLLVHLSCSTNPLLRSSNILLAYVR